MAANINLTELKYSCHLSRLSALPVQPSDHAFAAIAGGSGSFPYKSCAVD